MMQQRNYKGHPRHDITKLYLRFTRFGTDKHPIWYAEDVNNTRRFVYDITHNILVQTRDSYQKFAKEHGVTFGNDYGVIEAFTFAQLVGKHDEEPFMVEDSRI